MPANGSKTRLFLYGAYGYTGRLTAELAAARKLDIVLAGRDQGPLSELGERLSLSTRVVRLTDSHRLSEALKDIACVVHMAGPFALTFEPMLNACLATRTDYIDVTGEIEVFEAIWSRRAEIRNAGITAIPGAGFDVVPTDCLVTYVAGKLTHPSSILIALDGSQGVSQGTARTAIRQILKPALCRRSGIIVVLDDGSPRLIDFGDYKKLCIPVSWGDVATAFYSTGVGNITVYIRRPKLFLSGELLERLWRPLLRSRIGQSGLAGIVRMLPEGPSKNQKIVNRTRIVAEATDNSGRSVKAGLVTTDAYDFTAHSALAIATRIRALPSALGLVTPSQAFGADFVLTLPGCSRMDIPSIG